MKYEEITSRKNTHICFAAALSEKKNRDKSSLYSFEGIKLAGEALACGVEISQVFFTEKAEEKENALLEMLFKNGAELFRVTPEVYEKLTYEKASQEIFCVAKKPSARTLSEKSLSDGAGFVVLESVRDPSNVGAILRTAVALGCDKLLLTDDCADIYNYKAVRAAMGAVFRADVYYTSEIKQSINRLKTIGNVYAAALCEGAESISDISFLPGDSVVIGNEGHGVSDSVLESCSGTAIIPMMCGTESLNASVAAALFIWEKQRCRR